MQLARKGQQAPVGTGLACFFATLEWTTNADFDLMLFARKAGTNSDGDVLPVFYNNQSIPGITLSDDAGVGDQGGNNQEQAQITDFSPYSEIYIVVTDYGAVAGGAQARFDQADIKLTLQGFDSSGEEKHNHEIKPSAGMTGNVCCIGKLYRNGAIWMFQNVSEPAALKGMDFTPLMIAIGAYARH